MTQQNTIKVDVEMQGIGLHSGQMISMAIKFAPADHGIVFLRTDLPDGENVIPALWDKVSDTQLCTVISNEYGASVGTIEHLMSALRGLQIDNALIEIDGAEVPVMDGSAMPFIRAIGIDNIAALDAPRKVIKVLKTVEIQKDGKTVTLSPADTSIFGGAIEFDHPEIGRQHYSTQLLNGNFVHDIAEARTFGFLHEVEWMRSQGLARGGSLDNAIVLDPSKVMNEDGLRFDDEFIRHKLLDAIGDLYLAGYQIAGEYDGFKAGHALNNDILHALFADESNWALVNADDLSSAAHGTVDADIDAMPMAAE